MLLTRRWPRLRFCPNCGTALVPAKKDRSVVFTCPACNYETESGWKDIRVLKPEKENIVVIGKKEQKFRTMPKVKAECPKCRNEEAFYWLVQTRGADESSTQFFRCTSCGTTWREYT